MSDVAKAASGSEKLADVNHAQGSSSAGFFRCFNNRRTLSLSFLRAASQRTQGLAFISGLVFSHSLQRLLGSHSVPLKGGSQRGCVGAVWGITMTGFRHRATEICNTLQCMTKEKFGQKANGAVSGARSKAVPSVQGVCTDSWCCLLVFAMLWAFGGRGQGCEPLWEAQSCCSPNPAPVLSVYQVTIMKQGAMSNRQCVWKTYSSSRSRFCTVTIKTRLHFILSVTFPGVTAHGTFPVCDAEADAQ